MCFCVYSNSIISAYAVGKLSWNIAQQQVSLVSLLLSIYIAQVQE